MLGRYSTTATSHRSVLRGAATLSSLHVLISFQNTLQRTDNRPKPSMFLTPEQSDLGLLRILELLESSAAVRQPSIGLEVACAVMTSGYRSFADSPFCFFHRELEEGLGGQVKFGTHPPPPPPPHHPPPPPPHHPHHQHHR